MSRQVLSRQVQWQHPTIVRGGIDQTQLSIVDAPAESQPFSFAVIGDTDAGTGGSPDSVNNFARAFVNQLTQNLGDSRFVMHTGDVVYPMGTYQNFFNDFLQPYQSFLTGVPISPVYQSNTIVFNRPLLPVPGNHDYADYAGFSRVWGKIISILCHQLRQMVNVDLGHYGGAGGEAYGQTFLDDLATLTPNELTAHLVKHYSALSEMSGNRPSPVVSSSTECPSRCLSYRPGHFTRLPNRYYRFRYSGVDFFALDSNTWNVAPNTEGFDAQQLDWLEQSLITSWQTPNTVGRIIYLHHSPYTTEETRWQSSDTLWVRRHLRAVLDRVSAALETPTTKKQNAPIVDLVLSGHAHCLEYVQTTDTGHADAFTDWIVCGGSGAGLRRQRKNETEILENIETRGRNSTRVVAKSRFYAGVQGRDRKKQYFHSFLKIEVRPSKKTKFIVRPFVVARGRNGWQTKALEPLSLNTSPHSASYAL